MRIMVIADEESSWLWDHFEKEKLAGVDLIISCGDLHPHYLSFLTTFTSAPVLYVHGNHDDKYEQVPPEGCTCIEDQIFVYEGIRILGLGGSMRYRPGTNQYTEREMKKRVSKLWFPLLRRGGFDILVTHSPAYQLGDGRDLPHQGFRTFVDLKLWHIQFNVVNRETLLAAQKDPDKYRNLVVRVAGYCAYFTDLSEKLQTEIINRTEHTSMCTE